MTVALMTTAFTGTAFAKTDDYANGSYEMGITMMKATDKTTASMCNSIFAPTADVTLTDDATVIKFYVAYPIPNYPNAGTDGTLKDVVATYDGEEYAAEIDITTKATKTFTADSSSTIFGISTGDELETEAMTLTLPEEAITTVLSDGISISAYVNAVMNSTQTFYLVGSNLTAVGGSSSEEETATETSTESVEVSAEVEKNSPSYTVTVPEAVAIGKVSKTEDTVTEFTVKVTASDMESGKVTVSAAESGNLVSGNNTLAFANDFGTQTVTGDCEDKELNGNITVTAANAKAAKAGNYTGTATFTISYFAASSTEAE